MLEKIKKFVDERKGGDDCFYNGYLEDFIQLDDLPEGVPVEIFSKVVEKYPAARVCVNLKQKISQVAVSNQVIGYKDAFKLPGNAVVIPYLIVLQEEEMKRYLVVVPPKEHSYLYAKGFYLCLTEPGSECEEFKNNIVATVADERLLSVVDRCFQTSMGKIQRELDQIEFSNYDQMYDLIMITARNLCDTILSKLIPLEDKEELIRQTVVQWFLLKKVAYVQYMLDRVIATQYHQGDTKAQRREAKLKSKKVPFIIYSELWRCSNSNLPKEEE
ncbi:MAG: hypothetical protein ACK5LZ_03405 [Anaerorhabdus sp.]